MGLSSTEVCRPQLCILHGNTLCHNVSHIEMSWQTFDILWPLAFRSYNLQLEEFTYIYYHAHISETCAIRQNRNPISRQGQLLWWDLWWDFGCLSVKHAAGILMFITQEAAWIEALCPGHSCYEPDPEDCYQPSRSSQTLFWFVNILYIITYILWRYHMSTEWQLDCADMSCLQRAGWHGQMSNQGRPCNSL